MKRLSLFPVIIAIFLNTSFSIVQEKPASNHDIYDAGADVKALIASGLKAAQEQNKHLLLMFGGNWCSWCHRLHDLFQSDQQIKTLFDKSFILIMVDIGEKKEQPQNRDFVKEYRVEGFGYPALAVIGKDGKLLCAQSTGVLEKGKGHDPKKVLSFLIAQAPAVE